MLFVHQMKWKWSIWSDLSHIPPHWYLKWSAHDTFLAMASPTCGPYLVHPTCQAIIHNYDILSAPAPPGHIRDGVNTWATGHGDITMQGQQGVMLPGISDVTSTYHTAWLQLVSSGSWSNMLDNVLQAGIWLQHCDSCWRTCLPSSLLSGIPCCLVTTNDTSNIPKNWKKLPSP